MPADSSLPTPLVESVTFPASDAILPADVTSMHGATVTRIGAGEYEINLGGLNQIDATQRSVIVSQAGGAGYAVRKVGADTDRLLRILTFTSADPPVAADTDNEITVEVKRIRS